MINLVNMQQNSEIISGFEVELHFYKDYIF
jgi:hypothetical protein